MRARRLPGLLCLLAASLSLAPGAMARRAPLPAADAAERAALAQALARVPGPTHPLAVRLPQPRRYRLKNGLQLVVLENHHLPTVTMTLRVRAGSFYELPEKQGTAALTAAMLEEGTRTRSREALAAEADALGASLDADAEQGGPMATVHASGFAEDTAALMGLLADVVRHPSFPAEPFARVRNQTVAGLVQDANDPETLAEVAALRSVYGDTPPAQVLPPIPQVEKITPEDLATFHAAYYRPERAILGIAGDVDPDAMRRLVERAFGDWKRGEEPMQAAIPEYAPAGMTRVVLVDRPGSVQTVLRLTNLGIRRTSPDYPAVVVLDHILGGTYTSRLWKNIRETKGWAYDVHSEFTAPHYVGAWYAGAQVRNAVTGEAVAQFLHEFERLREEKVAPDELAGAKQSIIGRFARQAESPASLLDNALDVVQYGLPQGYWQKFIQRIQAVNDGDVRRVARRYLVHPQIIAVGERAEIAPALKAFGPIVSADGSR